MSETFLVRYGAIPDVARFFTALNEPLQRGRRAVVRTHRGIEVGTLLEPVNAIPASSDAAAESDLTILRPAPANDEARVEVLRFEGEQQFDQWQGRIKDWNLSLELIDLEWMLDYQKLVLYVLNDRGPDCTKLALQAASAGLGIIEIQLVNAEGLVQAESSGGGCASCGR